MRYFEQPVHSLRNPFRRKNNIMNNENEAVPKRCDFVWIDLDPQAGHEQRGRRPALIISKTEFNRATGFAWVCPVTSVNKGYPFHVPIQNPKKISGVVMVDQAKSLDYRKRKMKRIEACDSKTFDEVLARVEPILF